MELNDKKKFHLLLEVQTSIKLLQLGLAEMQKINMENDFYCFPFLLLSNGLERLLKCIKCYYYLNSKNRFPNINEIRTHNLVDLNDEILSGCFEPNLESKCQAIRQDYKFIKYDLILKEIITILSEFGESSRYYNLDIVTEKEKPSVDVEKMWGNLECNIAKENTDYQEIVKSIVIKIEKYIRALTRQFSVDNLGREATVCTGCLKFFLNLTDNSMGLTDYSKL